MITGTVDTSVNLSRSTCFPTDSYRGVKVAVLGASGFIGRWVAGSLCERRAKVHLIVRDKMFAQEVFRTFNIQGDIAELDLRDHEMVKRVLRKIRPSITFNLAGYGVDRSERDEDAAYQINAHLVKVICEAVAEVGDPEWGGQDIVHVGSAFEYGAAGGNLSGDTVPNPTTLYGKSKLLGANLLKEFCATNGLKGVTARLFTVYGSGEHCGRLLPLLLEVARTGKLLKLTAGTQKRDFTYVGDAAEGLLRLGLAAAKPGEIVNLATGRLVSVRSFAETAARILHIPRERLEFGSIQTRYQEMEHSEVALGLLRRLVGWVPPTSVEEGIRSTVDFEKRARMQCAKT